MAHQLADFFRASTDYPRNCSKKHSQELLAGFQGRKGREGRRKARDRGERRRERGLTPGVLEGDSPMLAPALDFFQ